ncbi:heterokaryon incompatibility, partial [Pyrenochaeta sp. MPI-SDFR-AT-0127]
SHEYHCLSYTWGNPFGPDPKYYVINIDDGFLSITPNLWSAIIHLHKTRPEFQAIWIDAICINQDNEDEKSAQVPIMHHIYGQAKSVIAWVGPEDTRNENPKLVVDVVKALNMQEEAREGFC